MCNAMLTISVNDRDAATFMRSQGWTQRGTIWFDADGIEQGWNTDRAFQYCLTTFIARLRFAEDAYVAAERERWAANEC